MSTIDEVKARLGIVETVNTYVPSLKKAGRTYKAVCPFHSERTPSFTVDPERGTWHCFGACATGGDVIEFVRRIEGLDFKEALRRCAERAGVEMTSTAGQREEREAHERLLRANEAAAIFFQSMLTGPQGAEALRYLESRGVDATTRQTWQLGYAPDDWRTLLDHLGARGFTEGDLVAAGLAIEPDGGGRPYDRFRNRVIFPTRDERGRMIGFGARALRPEDEPRYLNTPQTPLFDKSATLYGLDRASDEARRADRVIVVEGYMDVIAAHQFGIRNAVASMGTAITDRQMALTKRFTHNVVLALDADTAGADATLRAVQVAAEAADREAAPTVDWRGLVSYQDVLQADIRVTTLPPGEDPDSLVRQDPARFRALVDGARPVIDHVFEAATSRFDLSAARERSQALDALAPTVAAITDAVVRAHYVQRLARLAQVDERTVLALLGRRAQRRPVAVPDRPEVARKAVRAAPAPDGETQLLLLLLHREEARGARHSVDEDAFEDSTNRRLFLAWREGGDLAQQMPDLDDDLRTRFAELEAMKPEWLDARYLDGRYVEEMALSMATQLRLRRRGARLAPAARQVASQLTAARRGVSASDGAVDGMEVETTDDITAEELATELTQMAERQRTLAREYREHIRRQPAHAGGERQIGDEADDADF